MILSEKAVWEDEQKNVLDSYKIGDEVESEIINLDRDNKKIKLSIKKIETSLEDEENKELLEKYGTAE